MSHCCRLHYIAKKGKGALSSSEMLPGCSDSTGSTSITPTRHSVMLYVHTLPIMLKSKNVFWCMLLISYLGFHVFSSEWLIYVTATPWRHVKTFYGIKYPFNYISQFLNSLWNAVTRNRWQKKAEFPARHNYKVAQLTAQRDADKWWGRSASVTALRGDTAHYEAWRNTDLYSFITQTGDREICLFDETCYVVFVIILNIRSYHKSH
jgi:hypothetical protein